MMGASQVKSMRLVRLRVSMLRVLMSMPPTRLVRWMMLFRRHRMLLVMERLVLLVRHLVIWGRCVVFPRPRVLRSRGGWGGWSLVG